MKKKTPHKGRHPDRHHRKFFRPLLETLETREQVGTLLTHYLGMSPLLAMGGGLTAAESHGLPPFATDSAGSTKSSSRLAVMAGESDQLWGSGAWKTSGDLPEAFSAHRETNTSLAAEGHPVADRDDLSPLAEDLWGVLFDPLSVPRSAGPASLGPAYSFATNTSEAGTGSAAAVSADLSGGSAPSHPGLASGGQIDPAQIAGLPDPALGAVAPAVAAPVSSRPAVTGTSTATLSPPSVPAAVGVRAGAEPPTVGVPRSAGESQSHPVPMDSEPAPELAARSAQQQIGFAQGVDGWDVHITGGSPEGKGSVRAGSAILTEGDSFLVGVEQTFVVPTNPAPLVFRYTDLHFDTS
ncbi:MAG TPA: hypothetical protein VKD72_36720, partial [Gemmataceae bacterium]|nr:hypothetical protein [Gemmataceae bacterium]